MNFLELHVVFFVISLLLLIIEVMMGMAIGIALSGSITFFILGTLEWADVVHGVNSYLIIGSIIFVIATFFVLRIFRNQSIKKLSQTDINDY